MTLEIRDGLDRPVSPTPSSIKAAFRHGTALVYTPPGAVHPGSVYLCRHRQRQEDQSVAHQMIVFDAGTGRFKEYDARTERTEAITDFLVRAAIAADEDAEAMEATGGAAV